MAKSTATGPSAAKREFKLIFRRQLGVCVPIAQDHANLGARLNCHAFAKSADESAD